MVWKRLRRWFNFPNYFNLAASVARPNIVNSTSAGGYTYREIITRSIFGKVGVGYKNFAFLRVRLDGMLLQPYQLQTIRTITINFWFTCLSELYKGELRNIMSFAKVRAAYATAATDLGFNEVNVLLNNGNLYQGNAFPRNWKYL